MIRQGNHDYLKMRYILITLICLAFPPLLLKEVGGQQVQRSLYCWVTPGGPGIYEDFQFGRGPPQSTEFGWDTKCNPETATTISTSRPTATTPTTTRAPATTPTTPPVGRRRRRDHSSPPNRTRRVRRQTPPPRAESCIVIVKPDRTIRRECSPEVPFNETGEFMCKPPDENNTVVCSCGSPLPNPNNCNGVDNHDDMTAGWEKWFCIEHDWRLADEKMPTHSETLVECDPAPDLGCEVHIRRDKHMRRRCISMHSVHPPNATFTCSKPGCKGEVVCVCSDKWACNNVNNDPAMWNGTNPKQDDNDDEDYLSRSCNSEMPQKGSHPFPPRLMHLVLIALVLFLILCDFY